MKAASMSTHLEVLFTPADFSTLQGRDLTDTACVVFDVLRATSTMVTAVANGAVAILPVCEISEALAVRRSHPGVLLAGERDGFRIRRELTGDVDFDLGNSPREFVPEVVSGKTIVMTTTNGTRGLRACQGAGLVLAASFLNLGAVARCLAQSSFARLCLVCSGTFEQAAYEDVLAAGALCDAVWESLASGGDISDSAQIARQIYLADQANLGQAVLRSRNARRLLSRSELRDDVPFCLQRDRYDFNLVCQSDGVLRRVD